jgi:hypothetical protein
MRRQTGGSFTLNERSITAEELLDKFSKTYLEKHIFQADKVFYKTLQTYLTLGQEEGLSPVADNIWLVFDKRKKLFLEESQLNFDGIEKRVYNRIQTDGAHYITKKSLFSKESVNHGLIFTLANPTYIFIDEQHKINNKAAKFLADHPFIRRDKTNSNLWKLWVMEKNVEKETTIQGEYENPEDFILHITKQYTNYNGDPESRSQMTTYKLPSDTMNISNIDIFNQLKTDSNLIPNIIYELIEGKLRAFYARPRSANEWVFHPHNLIGILPNTKNEEIFISLFSKISQILSKLKAVPTDNYRSLPDKFWHIHVSIIPNEEVILLTCHTLYEINANEKELERFSKYVYKNKNNKLYKSGRIELINAHPKLNNDLVYKAYSRAHSAYILLKPNTSSHALYKQSMQNQAGNPFLNPDVTVYDFLPRFSFGQTSFGVNKFDLNHIDKKGVIFGSSNSSEAVCEIFCNASNTMKIDLSKNMRNKYMSFIRGTSTPAKPEEVRVWNENVKAGKLWNEGYTYTPPAVSSVISNPTKKKFWNKFRFTRKVNRESNVTHRRRR